MRLMGNRFVLWNETSSNKLLIPVDVHTILKYIVLFRSNFFSFNSKEAFFFEVLLTYRTLEK
jgi:hypothetical protein